MLGCNCCTRYLSVTWPESQWNFPSPPSTYAGVPLGRDDRECGGSLDEVPWMRLIDLLPDKLRVALVDSTFGVNSCESVLFAVVGRFIGDDVPLERTLCRR